MVDPPPKDNMKIMWRVPTCVSAAGRRQKIAGRIGTASGPKRWLRLSV